MFGLKVLFLLFSTSYVCCENVANVGIIGGHKISIRNVPYMASLLLNGTYHWCGGSIIHEQFILTAAHCIVENREYKVLIGTDDLNKGGEKYDVQNITIHPEYSHKTHLYDVCVIKLSKKVEFGEKVDLIKLAKSASSLKGGTLVNVTGWGNDGREYVSPYLRQVTLPIVKRSVCKKLYFPFLVNITPKQICAGTAGRDSCQGDSGGPLTFGDLQIGITSIGRGCGELPGVYIKVSSVYNWINNVIKQNL